jgi:flagellar assembly protein FliH
MSATPRPLALSALASRQAERPPAHHAAHQAAHAGSRRFLFEDDFASPQDAARARGRLAQAAPEPEVIAPSFTAEELAEARTEGVAEGRAAGIAEAHAGIEARLAAALETIATRLGEARREAAVTAELATGALAATTLDLVARALPRAAAAHARPGCAELAESLLAKLSGVERIAIRLPPELARALAPRLEAAAAAADFTGRLDVIPTDGMVAGEMRISWPGGEARRDPASLAEAAGDVLRQLGLAPSQTDKAGTATAVVEQEDGDGR